MEVIPVINCPDFKCVRRLLKKVRKIQSPWVHIDLADGRFTRVYTWQRPQDLINEKNKFSLGKFFSRFFSKAQEPELSLEVHLMTDNPEVILENWLKAGVKRVVVHMEAVADGWVRILAKCEEYKAELMVAVAPETPLDNLILLLNRYPIHYVQILAVKPGPAGQKFDNRVLEKIKILKKETPSVKIEVDGGINLETARLAKDAGADMVTSAHYIWVHLNHKKAFEELQNV